MKARREALPTHLTDLHPPNYVPLQLPRCRMVDDLEASDRDQKP